MKSENNQILDEYLENMYDAIARVDIIHLKEIINNKRYKSVNINHIDDYDEKHNKTLLIEAVLIGNLEIIETLINAGANVNLEAYYTCTPIACAKNEATLNLLFNYGADVNFQIKNYNSILINAVTFDAARWMVDLLLDKGAMTNTVNDVGLTALMIAANNDCAQVVTSLLNKGANQDITWSKDETAYCMAIKMNAVATISAFDQFNLNQVVNSVFEDVAISPIAHSSTRTRL